MTSSSAQLQAATLEERLTQLIEGFLLTCRVEGKSAATISFYGGILKRFLWWLEDREVTQLSISSFLSYIQTADSRWDSDNPRARTKAGQVTVQRYYTGLKGFFNWAVAEGLIDHNPMATLKKPKAPKGLVKAVSPEDIGKLLGSLNGRDCNSIRNRAILMVMLDSGLRLSEIASLRVSALNGEFITVGGRGPKERRVRIGARAQKAVWRYLMTRRSDGDALWLSREGTPLAAGGIQQMVTVLGSQLGIALSPHRLRHGLSCLYLNNGGDLRSLQLLLGHAPLSTTQGYVQSLDFGYAAAKHRLASPMDNFKGK